MEIHYCNKCHIRVSSVDIKEGLGIKYEGKVYCKSCADEISLEKKEKIYVKALNGKVYKFSELDKFDILIRKNLVDLDSQIKRPSDKGKWQSVRTIPDLANKFTAEPEKPSPKKAAPESPH